MLALEIEAPIVDHSVTVRSELLPAQASMAKVIVLYQELAAGQPDSGARTVLAEFTNRPFRLESFEPLSREQANER